MIANQADGHRDAAAAGDGPEALITAPKQASWLAEQSVSDNDELRDLADDLAGEVAGGELDLAEAGEQLQAAARDAMGRGGCADLNRIDFGVVDWAGIVRTYQG